MHTNTNMDTNETKKSFFIVLSQKNGDPNSQMHDCQAPGQHKNLYEMKDNDNITVCGSSQHPHRVRTSEI